MSTGLWVLAGILGFLLLLLLLPIRIRVRHGEELTVWGGLGLVLIKVVPIKKKKASPKRLKASKGKRKDKIPKNKPSPGPLTMDKLMEWLEFGKSSLGTFKGLMRIRYFKLHAIIGGDDPAAVALLYGGTAAALSTLYPILESGFRIRKTDIFIDADFGGKGSLLLETELRMTPIAMVIAGFKFFNSFAVIQKSQQNINEKEEAQS